MAAHRGAPHRGAETTVVEHPDTRASCAVRSACFGQASRTPSSACAGSVPRRAPLEGVPPEDHVDVWLVDKEDANLDLRGVVSDAADAVRQLRSSRNGWP
jgi:hypothetical protein